MCFALYRPTNFSPRTSVCLQHNKRISDLFERLFRKLSKRTETKEKSFSETEFHLKIDGAEKRTEARQR